MNQTLLSLNVDAVLRLGIKCFKLSLSCRNRVELNQSFTRQLKLQGPRRGSTLEAVDMR